MKKKLIGLYELITGIFGAILVLMNIGKGLDSQSLLLQIILGVVLFSGVAYAGYALLNNLKNGLRFSILAQALQSIALLLPGFQYKFTGSAFLSVLIGPGGLSFHSKLTPIDFSIASTSAGHLSIEVYLIALLLLVLLLMEKK